MFSSIFSAIISAVLPAAFLSTCTSTLYHTDFDSQQPELVYETVDATGTTDEACAVYACTTFEQQGQRTFGNFTILPGSPIEAYTDAATSQVAVGTDPAPVDAGPYSLTNGHSITLESKIKFSDNYDLLGQGAAQGTAGIVLWNSAIGSQGQTPEYDQLGFQWLSQDILSGFFGSGFAATTLVDVFPVGVTYPVSTLDLHNWFKVKLVWSQDMNGVQSVTYYVDGQYVSTDVLPVQLHGLSLEIWNDNQEPYFCETGFCPSYPNPVEEQNLYVDYVTILKI